MRPRAVTAIAWGWLAIGAILAAGGVSSALDPPLEIKEADILDFPFAHPVLFGAILELLALTSILASLALLRLRKWGARVIEVAAWLGLVYLAGFAVFAVCFLALLLFRTDIMQFQPWFPPAFAGVLVFNLAVLGTPLLLTVRHLRRRQTRALLS